jgi:hypothetical protein
VAALVCAGCGGNADHARTTPTTATTTAVTGPAASCGTPSPTTLTDAGREVHGRGEGAELWGLLMVRRYPMVAGDDVSKIVWRMTGSGPLRAGAYDPDGRAVRLAWGPEPHGGSTYHRPGEEWGAGYRFRRAGCYRLTFARTKGRAEVWLRIRPPGR